MDSMRPCSSPQEDIYWELSPIEHAVGASSRGERQCSLHGETALRASCTDDARAVCMALHTAWSLNPFQSTQAGISLSVRNVLSISVILTGTSLVANLGAVTLAAHEIVRQVCA